MKEFTISEVKEYHTQLINSEPFIVSGYCDYNSKQRTESYRYAQLINFDGSDKISILEGDTILSCGVFYQLKVQPYFQKNSNEIALKVLKVIEQNEHKLIYNYKHFSIIKNKLEKGTVNIEEYFSILLKKNKNLKIGFITLKTSVAYSDIVKSLYDINKSYIKDQEISLSVENISSTFKTARELENKNKVDFWIITRGGGNLSFFNSYDILKNTSSLKKPIITALGHSTDYTLTDFIADRVFRTPTAFGEYLNKFLNSYRFEEDKVKIYNDALNKSEEQKIQINSLNSQLSIKEKQILSKNEEIKNLKILLAAKEKEIEKFNALEKRLDEMSKVLNFNIYSNELVNLFKNFSPNTKKVIYFIAILLAIKIVIAR